jgi:hypothetical protein
VVKVEILDFFNPELMGRVVAAEPQVMILHPLAAMVVPVSLLSVIKIPKIKKGTRGAFFVDWILLSNLFNFR